MAPPMAHTAVTVLLLLGAAIAGAAAQKAPIIIIPGLAASDLRGFFSTANAAAAAGDEPVFSPAAAAAAAIAAAGGEATPEQVQAVAAALAEFDRNQTTTSGDVGSSDVCPVANGSNGSPKLLVWPPFDPRFLLFQSCFYHVMRLNYIRATNTFSQNVNSNVVVNDGSSSGTEYFVYKIAGYDDLTSYISTTFGYTTGKDLFAAPYDWRQDLTAMDQNIGDSKLLDRLAARIRRIVATNGGRKAVLLTHSMGGIVALELLTKSRFAAWREANVRGFITLGTPFGGAVNAVAYRVGGYPYLLPSAIEELLGDRIRNISYAAAMGMPSPVMLMPYAPAMLPADWVLVRTPARTYTVQQLPELLAAIGDDQAASFYNQVHRLDERLSMGSLLENVTMFSIYGRNVSTPKTWSFPSNIRAGVPTANGSVALWGEGDGIVNLESLRLCNRLTKQERVIELDGDISHTTVLTDPVAQAAIGRALQAILA